jgi:hypothetical protein
MAALVISVIPVVMALLALSEVDRFRQTSPKLIIFAAIAAAIAVNPAFEYLLAAP